MTTEEILENLCYYDKRNPNSIEDDDMIKTKTRCYCDNCFYGRTVLALELLKYVTFN